MMLRAEADIGDARGICPTGEVPERSKGTVSKIVVGFAHRGFESLPLRCNEFGRQPHAAGFKKWKGAREAEGARLEIV